MNEPSKINLEGENKLTFLKLRILLEQKLDSPDMPYQTKK